MKKNSNQTEIKYVLYEREKNNEYVKSLNKLSDVLRKIIRTKDGVIMEEFYDFSKYKNVKSLDDLSGALLDNEYLAIVLDEETEKLVNPDNVITYVTHETKKTTPKREIGDKLYLVKYNEFSLSGLGKDKAQFVAVQLKMNSDETCSIEGIQFLSDSVREVDDVLISQYGGYSGLYWLTANKEMLEKYTDCYFEATKTDDNKWDVIKLDKTKGTKAV